MTPTPRQGCGDGGPLCILGLEQAVRGFSRSAPPCLPQGKPGLPGLKGEKVSVMGPGVLGLPRGPPDPSLSLCSQVGGWLGSVPLASHRIYGFTESLPEFLQRDTRRGSYLGLLVGTEFPAE